MLSKKYCRGGVGEGRRGRVGEEGGERTLLHEARADAGTVSPLNTGSVPTVESRGGLLARAPDSRSKDRRGSNPARLRQDHKKHL